MKPDDYQKQCMIFLSTPSVWRATPPRVKWKIWLLFLSTPSVWRATPLCRLRFLSPRDFYPRSPCGGRRSSWRCRFNALLFLSTPSVWRATLNNAKRDLIKMISIHALRVEGDPSRQAPATRRPNFYPRPPCGGRLQNADLQLRVADFYPRPPCGGRPRFKVAGVANVEISIHALRVEGDCRPAHPLARSTYFYPRPPCGGRLLVGSGHFLVTDFYPRPPCGGRPKRPAAAQGLFSISIHALRVEGDGVGAAGSTGSADFYPRPPCGGRP